MDDTEKIIRNLISIPYETQWLEFKKDKAVPEDIGEYISALGNSATCEDHELAYAIWGVDDKTHAIIGTSFNPATTKIGNEELENWLHHSLSSNAVFTFQTVEIDGKRLVLLTIQKAILIPITFNKEAYIRSGSYKKKLRDIPALEIKLWDKLKNIVFENEPAMSNLDMDSVLNQLNYQNYFDMTKIRQPTDAEAILHYLSEDKLVLKQDDGRYTITNAGALLFAKKLDNYPRLSHKQLRIIRYNGNTRLTAKYDTTIEGGYVSSFNTIIQLISSLIQNTEILEGGLQKTIPQFPEIIIRELVVNALIHQDFTVTGMRPMVEIFDNRIEITNPGVPLVNINHILDNPPKSRNELIVKLMRRCDLSEERGSGWDKIVMASEIQYIPAPRFTIYAEATKVTVYEYIPFENLSSESKIWSCYLHACLKYANDDMLTNRSLRERFKMPQSGQSSISRLIKLCVSKGCIKPFDTETAPRYMRYVPYWA